MTAGLRLGHPLIPLLHVGGGVRGGGYLGYSRGPTSPYPSPPSGGEGTRRYAVHTAAGGCASVREALA
jgi:hypothetical protein